MSDELTMDDVAATIVAKSDQLNADDLVGGPITCKIEKVTRGSAEQPVSVHLVGRTGRPWKPCKTERRVLVAAWGADPRTWVGRSVRLKRDAAVLWGGKAVGGVRLDAMDGIERDLVLSLAVAKGKKEERRVARLVVEAEPKPPTFEDKRAALAAKVEAAGIMPDMVEAWGDVGTWDPEACKDIQARLRGGGAA
jgi:hypothetical protein